MQCYPKLEGIHFMIRLCFKVVYVYHDFESLRFLGLNLMWCGCMTIGPLNELSYPNTKSLSNCFIHWEHAIVSLCKYFSLSYTSGTSSLWSLQKSRKSRVWRSFATSRWCTSMLSLAICMMNKYRTLLMRMQQDNLQEKLVNTNFDHLTNIHI